MASSTIVGRTTAEIDIRNLTDSDVAQGRASIVLQCGEEVELVHLEPPRDQLVVGRVFPADVRVDIPSLSRQHARFGWANGQLTVEDLGSRNGTWLGDERIDRRELSSGDQVKLGGLAATVIISPPSTRRAAAPIAVPSKIETGDPTQAVCIEGALVLSAAMRELYKKAQQVANSDLPVLIVGETGTGKELIARAIHQWGSRSAKEMLAINCGAIPENLMESTLFGHEKGAFTGADRRKPGVFEDAQGSTLFLDEICELPLKSQPALLRVLEAKRVCRVGGSGEVEVDVRVLAATHCEVSALVQQGAFREDLLYRLNTITLHVPPLRDRVDEIEALATHFLRQACEDWQRSAEGLHPDALALLRTYQWPGNIRQLRNVMERGALLAEGDSIRVKDLPKSIIEGRQGPRLAPSDSHADSENGDRPTRRAGSEQSTTEDLSFQGQMSAHEANVIAEAIERTGGNRRAAARLLGVPYRTLLRKAGKHGIGS